MVEGYTDVIGMAQAGVKNVVASMGTSLTDGQIGLMMRFTSNVTFMFDADRAGTEAMLRSGELARGHALRPRVALLPAGNDPADVAVQGGHERVSGVLAGKMSLLGFELRQALDKSDTATSDGRVRAFEEVRRIMERAVSLKEREEEIPIVADKLRLSADSVALLLRSPGPRRQQAPSETSTRAEVMAERLLGTRPSSSGSSWWRRPAIPVGRWPFCRRSLRSTSPTQATGRSSRVSATPSPLSATVGTARRPWRGCRPAPTATPTQGASTCGWSWRPIRSAIRWPSSRSCISGYRRSTSSAGSPNCGAQLEQGGDVEQEQRQLFHLEQLQASVRASLTNLDPEEGRS